MFPVFMCRIGVITASAVDPELILGTRREYTLDGDTTHMFLGNRRKPETPEETQTDTGTGPRSGLIQELWATFCWFSNTEVEPKMSSVSKSCKGIWLNIWNKNKPLESSEPRSLNSAVLVYSALTLTLTLVWSNAGVFPSSTPSLCMTKTELVILLNQNNYLEMLLTN